MSGSITGSNNDFSRNDFNSGSAYSFHSKAASQSFNDLTRRSSAAAAAPKKTYASDIANRLPNIVFSGMLGLIDFFLFFKI